MEERKLYLDTEAAGRGRAHYAVVRAGGPGGDPLLWIRLDTQLVGATTDEEWRAYVALAQELVDARNEKLLVKSQPSGPGLTPEQARAHAERLVKSLFLVGCIEATRYETATRELGYGLLNIFGRSDLPPFLRPPETRSEPDPTPTTAEEEIVAQEGSEGPHEAFAQEESPLDAALNAVQRLIESEGGEIQCSLFAQSVANQRQARALEQAEARAWEATCAALSSLGDLIPIASSRTAASSIDSGDLVRLAVSLGRATAQAFAGVQP